MLAIVVAFNLLYLFPETAVRTSLPNDGTLHVAGIARAIGALSTGQDPLDPWMTQIAMGYPLFHYYQHLPYLLPALVAVGLSALTGVVPSAFDLYRWASYLLLSLFPLSIYWSVRRFGYSSLTAGCAGLVSPLVATQGLYGLEYGSYVWRGYGLYTQLWGMVLLPPALAQGFVVLRDGRGFFLATLLGAATVLSHLAFGYMVFASSVLFALLVASRRSLVRTLMRLALLLALISVATSYFLVPLVLDGSYLNRSVWEDADKYDSYGHQWVLGALVRGDLFDFGRLPSLTLLAAVGAGICLWRWREPRCRFPLGLGALWLLLYFGRPTWGALLDVTPLSRDLHLHRLIAGVHLAGILLAGTGLSAIWAWASARAKPTYLLVPLVVSALLLMSPFSERASFLAHNGSLIRAHERATATEQRDLSALLSWLRQAPPGRVYAGLAGTWGRDYRIGDVPLYSLLVANGVDTLGFLHHSLSLNGDVQVLFDERRREQYDLFNVRYVIAPTDRTFPEFVTPVGEFGRHRLYQVATGGYFELVESPLTFVGGKGDFYPPAAQWLASDMPRTRQHPTVLFCNARVDFRQSFPLGQAEAVIPRSFLPTPLPRGEILSEAVRSNAYQVSVHVDRESTLLFKVTFHPNWRAEVNGVPSRTSMLMPSYVGVPLPLGDHLVTLRYEAAPLRTILLVLGVVALGLTAVLERRARRQTRRPRSSPSPGPAPTVAGPDQGAQPPHR